MAISYRRFPPLILFYSYLTTFWFISDFQTSLLRLRKRYSRLIYCFIDYAKARLQDHNCTVVLLKDYQIPGTAPLEKIRTVLESNSYETDYEQ